MKKKAQECEQNEKDVRNMAVRIGLDNEKYIQEQTAAIFERADLFKNKLYLEFGGKLLFDNHAAGFFQDLTLTLERYFPAHPIIF